MDRLTEESTMVNEREIRRKLHIATGLVIGVTILWAFLFVPRLGAHPQAIKDGAANSAWMFYKMQLAAAIFLLASIILSRLGRLGGKICIGLLYVAAMLVFLHDFMVFNGAVFYLQTYEGFRTVAILMLVCVGANLVAGILAIMAGNRLGRG